MRKFNQYLGGNRTSERTGGIVALMAFLIPVFLLICGISINFALMHLRKTELQIATDAAARAAGRAFSETQEVEAAIDLAVEVGQMNTIGSEPLLINPAEGAGEIVFGVSSRLGNGFGRYQFNPRNRSDIAAKREKATAIRVRGKRTSGSLGGSVEMFLSGFGPFSDFSPESFSTSTQLDRDIALVLDRSGSMLEYKDFPAMEDAIDVLFDNDLISNDQRRKAKDSIWGREFPYSEIFNGRAFFYYFGWWFVFDFFDNDLYEYARDYQDRLGSGRTPAYDTNDPAPRHSRWAQLEGAVDGFLGVLEETDQEELVSLITFNSSAVRERQVSTDYTAIIDDVVGIAPKLGTNITAGLQLGADSILDHAANPDARFFAAKTIVLLTDGEHTSGGMMPAAKAQQIVNANNVIIHAVTFSESVSESSRREMQEVANRGGGRYYHASNGEDLVVIFREIANNLPTLITD